MFDMFDQNNLPLCNKKNGEWPWLLFVLVCSAYRCPLCMHSACDMQAFWEERDKEIAQSPMPTEYKDATVKVFLCNDSYAQLWSEKMYTACFCTT